MNVCAPFRAELERALAGSADALARLASHEHARTCTACRAEVTRERALDSLLVRLSASEVPSALARRVLARLASERGAAAGPVAGRAGADDGDLDEVLGGLPAPRVPSGLAARILQGVAPAREARRPGSVRTWLFYAAAVLLVALTLWSRAGLRPASPGVELAQGAELEADEELLAYAVERWELLDDGDLDLWLASLDPVDELLIEFADEASWFEDGSGGKTAREGD